jgi:HSP20 family protein
MSTEIQKQDKKGVTQKEKPVRKIRPFVDIYENKSEIKLMVDMPGVTDNSMEVEVHSNQLRVAGERLQIHACESDDTKMPLVYERVFTLGENIDTDKIEANLKQGVLYIKLPIKEAAKPKKIKVTGA